MTRDLILVSCVLFCLWLTLKNPFMGVLAWTWLALMEPHREIYGYFSSTLRIQLTVAIVTIGSWYFSKQRKTPPTDATVVIVAIFLIWITFNNFFAVNPDLSWRLWDRYWRVIALALLIWATATNKVRIHAVVWIVFLCLAYYGVKGGLLSIMSGGTKKIDGPPDTPIGDNNQLAVALLMVLPLVNYLRLHTANRYIRYGLIGSFTLIFLAVVSSYSRGAFIASGALAVVGWVRSKNKFLYPILAAAVIIPVFHFMPEAYYNRLATLNDTGNDGPLEGRLLAWRVAYMYAAEHFPIGAGIEGPSSMYAIYFPGSYSRVSHSIYFQILGDNGFAGLAIYLSMLFLGFVNCQRIRVAARNVPTLHWARDLATMIQLSLVAFCVGGAALSLAYYDVPFIWMVLLARMLVLVRQTKARRPIGALPMGTPALAGPAYWRSSDVARSGWTDSSSERSGA